MLILLLKHIINFDDLERTRIKADASQYVCYVLRYVTIRYFVF